MSHLKNNILIILLAILTTCISVSGAEYVQLTLIPPTTITNKVDLDIRAGVKNNSLKAEQTNISIYLNKVDDKFLLKRVDHTIPANQSFELKHTIKTYNKVGKYKIILVVKNSKGKFERTNEIEIIDSPIRSTRLIDGAWAGITHWSEKEGKLWNDDIKKMTDNDWRQLVRSMHKLGMNIIIIQEVFRNEEYAGRHNTRVNTYKGKAYYPSKLYPNRMPIEAEDPLKAIFSEADKLGMHVMPGVGLFAWFDFTSESLEWHKNVAKELWDKYGSHPSFYGFYISEESGGSLDNWEKTPEKREMRKAEIVEFFKEMKRFTNHMAPAKPLMLATNSFDIDGGIDTYPKLLKHLDILCPFGFARMPDGDLNGQHAASKLQSLCDEAGSHLWFDLEAFLFNPDQSLYPRPITEIVNDLNKFDNFEKILCYQYPGVFTDPLSRKKLGDERTVKLFEDYNTYRKDIISEKINHSHVKPVKGTWLNLVYQDERNKYMNPIHVDDTNPEFWKQKIKEYAQVGLEYLIIMQVANERLAFYPSAFMKHAYPSDKQSPVEAIMEVADTYGLKVFMSCGWAVNQDDDLRKPEIRDIQQKIMNETANLFGKHSSFYGWYLPVEDSLEPILSDHAIDAVNTLTAMARSLTPEAKILISPYGLCNADVANPKFGDQIKKLKVDIIAYQDEVGCVREPMPMKRMKEHFRVLRKIHNETDIKLWANVESFTWEKETNSRTSALIPAAFPRYLSQIAGVSDAGVDEVVSFSIQGMLDSPNSWMFIGQPANAIKFYKDYADWKNGDTKWKILEKSFQNQLKHDAISAKVNYISTPSDKYNKGNLTDGNYAAELISDEKWVGFEGKDMEVVIDLGKSIEIKTITARFMQYRTASIFLPTTVTFFTSNDGTNYTFYNSYKMEINNNDLHDCWIDMALVNGNINGRYIKIIAENSKKAWLFCDEVLVNP